MPQVRKLDPEEVKAIENKGKGPRKLNEELYDSILSEYNVGEYGEAILDEADNRLTIRNRLKAAAARRGFGIDFRRTTGDMLRFQVVERSNGNGAAVTIEPPAPTKRRGGRPKKIVEPEPLPAKRKGGRPKKNP